MNADTCNMLPAELVIHRKSLADECQMRDDAAHARRAVFPLKWDDDPVVAGLYGVAFALWHAGDIDDECLDDLLDIVVK